jgi:GT2 family glycosyltransferase
MNDEPHSGCPDPVLSVIIPARNCVATLAEQLDALAAQTYGGDWELVVVDNGSTDGTADLVRRCMREHPWLRLVEARRQQGRCYACNAGAAAARGDVFVFCDADDVAAPTWLAALAAVARDHDVVAGAVEVERLNQHAPHRPKPFNSTRQPVLEFLPYAIGANVAISRRAYEAVGGYDESLPIGGDIDLSWRLQLAGFTLADAPDAVMHYRYRETMEGFWRQIVSYAEIHARFYARFAAHGMPRSSPWLALSRVRWLVRNLPDLFVADPGRRSQWVYFAAERWGRLRGSLRYRTWYP